MITQLGVSGEEKMPHILKLFFKKNFQHETPPLYNDGNFIF